MSFGKKQQAIKDLDEAREKLTRLNTQYSDLVRPFTHRSAKARKARMFLDGLSKASGDVIEALAATTRMIGPGDKDLTTPAGGYSNGQAFAGWLSRMVFAMIGVSKTVQDNGDHGTILTLSSLSDGSEFIEVPGGSQFLRLYWKSLKRVREELVCLRDIVLNVIRWV